MYYIVDLSSDLHIIGSQYPQIQKMKPRYDYNGPRSVYRVNRYYHALPDFLPDFDGFVLHTQAKLTDFLSNVFSPPFGFIISERAKSILQKFRLPLHAFYPIKLYHKKQRVDNYYWFHIIYDLTDLVDYQASIFYIDKFGYDLGNISISSKDDFFKKRENIELQNQGHNVTVWAKKLKFTQYVNFDFFRVGRIDRFTYVSENLYTVFRDEKLTGVVTQPYSESSVDGLYS